MANYENLMTAIQQVIYENGNQEITGSVMQATLLAMVNSLGAGYQFIGIATPSTNPGTPDARVFYLASTVGTYVNFSNIVLEENEVAILKYNGSWVKEASGFASAEKVNQLDQNVDKLITSQNVFSLMTQYADGTFLLPNGNTSTASGWKVYKLLLASVSGASSLKVSTRFSGGTGVSMACGYTSAGVFVENYYTVPSGVTDKTFTITPSPSVDYILFSKNNAADLVVEANVLGEFLADELNKIQEEIDATDETIDDYLVKVEDKTADLVTVQSSAILLPTGAISTSPSLNHYSVVSIPVAGAGYSFFKIILGYSGSGFSIAAGFDANGNFVRNYGTTASGGSPVSLVFEVESDIATLKMTRMDDHDYSFLAFTKGPAFLTNSDEVTVHRIYIPQSATGDNSLLGVLKTLSADTSSERPSKMHRYELILEPGIYNMDCSSDVSLLTRGVFVPPYTTIKGAGRGVTKLQYLYEGTSDTIMSEHSVLNMPYSCTIEDLTIEAENIRYAIHSDLPWTGGDANDKTIEMNNVEVCHYGVTNGQTPTYNIPNAWGGGTFNNNVLRFNNCRFFAAQCAPFASHDRTGLTKSSRFEFINCDFENGYINADLNDSILNPSVYFNSWGSGVPIYCSFQNCRIMRYIELAVSTTYNADAKCDYYVTADGDQLIRVAETNNSALARHWSDGCCKLFKFSNAISKGTPVVMTNTFDARAWTTSDGAIRFAGVLLHDVAQGGIGVVKMKGMLSQQILGAASFTQAATIGWDGSAWSNDASIKLVQMLTTQVGVIMPYTT